MAPNIIPGSYDSTTETSGKATTAHFKKINSIDAFVNEIISTAANPDGNYHRKDFSYTPTFNEVANYLRENQNPNKLDINEMTTGDVNVKIDSQKLTGMMRGLISQYQPRAAEAKNCKYRNDGFTMDVPGKDPQTARTQNLAAAMLAYGVTNNKIPDAGGCGYASVSRDIDNGGITFYFSRSPGSKYMN